MLNNFFKKLGFLICIFASFSLYASSSGLREESSSSSTTTRKRSSDVLDLLQHQVFGRPTYDTTAKYVLGDEVARLDFIKTFTGIPNITSTETLDNSLNPVQHLTNLRELLTDSTIKNFMSWVKKKVLSRLLRLVLF